MGCSILLKAVHGGDVYSRDIKYDFSANINPLGMPENAKKALIDNLTELEKYPDINCRKLKNSLSEFEKTAAEYIVCGNGAADLIYKIVQVLTPKKALVISPTFSEYERALNSYSCAAENYSLDENKEFLLCSDILNKINNYDIVFICNPNNPVGNIFDKELMTAIVRKCNEKNTYIVVDECFMGFADKNEQYSLTNMCSRFPKLIVLKAFTKIFAVPGLRLGYMISGNLELCEKVESCGQCWSVSAAAQIVGAALSKENEYLEKTIEYVKKERAFLTESIRSFDIKVYPSVTNFLLVKSVMPLDKQLLKYSIAVRSCGDFKGLGEEFFRIAVRTHCENIILINSIKSILNNSSFIV